MPTILVIFGITGDLAKRKLVPALDTLKAAGKLPEKFRLVGVSRSTGSDHFAIDVNDVREYARLATELERIEREWGSETQRLFHLAVPPRAAPGIIAALSQSEIVRTGDKLLLEKPFGLDVASAEALAKQLETFNDAHVCLIDHYLAKHIARELAAFPREDAIEKVEIFATETIGIEGRGKFYEATGALRDVVQSHLLELAALTLGTGDFSPTTRLTALESFQPATGAVRGQYEGYREEVGNEESTVETFASLMLHKNNVPIQLTIGKALSEKRVEARIYRKGQEPLIIRDEPEPLDGYSRVYLAAFTSDASIFVSVAEALRSWELIAPILTAWRAGPGDLIRYAKGSTLEKILNKP